MLKSTYTVKEVAKLLDFSTNTVYKHIDEGSIKAVRMGTEGRFRIPSTEVERLLQEKGIINVQQALPAAPTNIISQMEPVIEDKIHNAPSLFDWFVATMSICLGFSLIVFKNTSLAMQAATDFTRITVPFQVLLLVAGVVLIILDMTRRKQSQLRKIMSIVVSIDYLVMGIIFFLIGRVPLSAGYIGFGVVIVLATFVAISQQARYLLFVNIIGLLIGIGYIISPKSFFIPEYIGKYQNASLYILIIWAILIIFTAIFSILAIRKNGKYIWFIVIPTATVSMVYAIHAFSVGLWARTIFCVVLTSFSLIFPFAQKFESFTLKSKKDLALSFAWLLGLILAGSLMLFFVYHSFQDYALGELEKRVTTASDVAINFIDGNIAKTATFASDYELIDAIKGQTVDKALADYNLRQLYESANQQIARVVLVNANGVIVDTYPFLPASQGVNISGRDYFIAVKNGAKTYISNITVPSTQGVGPSVLISMPINDRDGKFLGALISSVDLTVLSRSINQIRFNDTGRYLLVDGQGNYIIAPTPDKTLTKAPEGSLALDALAGKSGAIQGADSSGKIALVAYKKIDKYGWGILAQQPYDEVFNPYSQNVFIIFFMLITAGVGSLLVVFTLKDGGKEGSSDN